MRVPLRAPVVVTVTAIAAWLTAVTVLERQPRKAAEGIIVTSPSKRAILDAESKVLWAGRNATDETCTVSEHVSHAPLKKGAFKIHTGPYGGYREELAWFDIECDKRGATHVARKIERPVNQKRVEIMRIALDMKRMKTQIEEEIRPEVERRLSDLKKKSFPEKGWYTIRIERIKTNAPPRLVVKEGFVISLDLGVWISVRGKSGSWTLANIELEGTIDAPIKIMLSQEGRMYIDLDMKLSHLKEFNANVFFIIPDKVESWIIRSLFLTDKDIKNTVKEIGKGVAANLTKLLKTHMNAFRENAGPVFAKWLANNEVIPRVINWVSLGDFGSTREKIMAGGEVIVFSIDAKSSWVGRPAPRLSINLNSDRSAVTLKVSYAMINKTIDVLVGESVADALAEAKLLRKVIDELEDGLTGNARVARSQGTQELEETLGEITRILKLAGFEFDTDLDFALPISVAPEGHDSIRFSLAGARIIQEARATPRAWLAVSAEVKMGLVRQPTKDERAHLRRHIAIEAVPSEGSREMVPRRYRALAGRMTEIMREEPTNWSVDTLDGEAAKVRKALNTLSTIGQLRLPIRIRIGKLDMQITGLENDLPEYAVVLTGKVQ